MSNPNISRTKGARSNGFEKQGSAKASACGKKGAMVRDQRAALRKQMLQIAADEGLVAKHFADAIKYHDMDLIEFCREAMKLVGLHYDQSPEAVQKLDIKTDNKTDANLNIHITDTEAK